MERVELEGAKHAPPLRLSHSGDLNDRETVEILTTQERQKLKKAVARG